MRGEGQIALWQALRHYDPGRGVAFSTCAVPNCEKVTVT